MMGNLRKAGGGSDILLFAAVLLSLTLLRVPVLSGAANLSPDATEHIDGARNFAAGGGRFGPAGSM